MPIIIDSKISHQFTQSPKENKNERRIKLENHRFSFVNPSKSLPFRDRRKSTIDKTLVAFIHHRTAILCRRGNSSPQISFCSKLKKRGSSREEDLGGQAFRPRSPRSKWLFRGQESRRCRRELKIRAIGHEGEGLVEEEEAELRFYPRAPVVVVVVVPPQLGWNFADIPLPLFRPLFSSSLLSLSLSFSSPPTRPL